MFYYCIFSLINYNLPDNHSGLLLVLSDIFEIYEVCFQFFIHLLHPFYTKKG